MRSHRNIENLSQRDQQWLDLGASFGSALKRALHRADFVRGGSFPADLRHRA